MLWKIALRNLLRNKRRTGFSLALVVIVTMGLVLFNAFVDYTYTGLRETMIRSQLGHLQIFQRPYDEVTGQSPLMHDYKSVKDIVSTSEHVAIVGARLNLQGLITKGGEAESISFIGLGVEPEAESYLSTFRTTVEGDPLRSDRPFAVHLGRGLAAQLSVVPGDWVTILGTTVDGVINALDVEVAGTVTLGVQQMDNRYLYMPIQGAQSLISSDAATNIVVLLDKTDHTRSVADQIEQRFAKEHLDLKIKRWDELAEYYRQVVSLYSRIFGVVSVIMLAIVIFSVSNTMSMSLMERIQELGTLRAVGATRPYLMKLLVTEGFLLGLLGGLAGVLVGVCACQFINSLHVVMPPAPGMTRGYPLGFRLGWSILTGPMLLVASTSVLSTLLPAWRGSRINIVEALRYV
ncbi:MAG: ABC transporter permease [Acidobacteria bacterium]|nr:ABC transporter permease [Acidobacteriota bacterium]